MRISLPRFSIFLLPKVTYLKNTVLTSFMAITRDIGNAAEPLAYVDQTATADANGYQADWLNAEVIDSRNVYIYQYYPGGHITLWRLTKQGGNLRGDADEDGTVTIADVTTLIDYILTGNTNDINLENADCDRDGEIGIADVTALIDFILTGSW